MARENDAEGLSSNRRRWASFTTWSLRGLGLLVVAVISGALWVAVRPTEPVPPPAPEPPSGQFQFSAVRFSDQRPECASVSTGKIASYFRSHPCVRLARTIRTTGAPDGSPVLTSVITVRMPNAKQAANLERLTRTSGTGNVEDLVTADVARVSGWPDKLPDSGYASTVRGSTVVLAESAYADNASVDNETLTKISSDAFRFAD